MDVKKYYGVFLNTVIATARVVIPIIVILFSTADPVQADITSSLVGHWTFDEVTGIVASDSSGSGNDGVLTNGPVWTIGEIGGAVDLDGIDDYVDAGSANSLDDIPVKTITAWIKRKDITKSQHVALKGYAGGPGGWEFYTRRSTGGPAATE